MSQDVLRAMCNAKRPHTLAFLSLTERGYEVRANWRIETPTGVELRWITHMPSPDAVEVLHVGCRCGKEFPLHVRQVMDAAEAGETRLFLVPTPQHLEQ